MILTSRVMLIMLYLCDCVENVLVVLRSGVFSFVQKCFVTSFLMRRCAGLLLHWLCCMSNFHQVLHTFLRYRRYCHLPIMMFYLFLLFSLHTSVFKCFRLRLTNVMRLFIGGMDLPKSYMVRTQPGSTPYLVDTSAPTPHRQLQGANVQVGIPNMSVSIIRFKILYCRLFAVRWLCQAHRALR